MTHPQPSPPSSFEAEQDLLDRLLREAFKPSSPEFESYTHLSNYSLIPESTTAKEIGLAASFSAVKQFFMTEHGLLGAGWAEWQIQPSGGDEILACCVRHAQDAILTFISYTHARQLQAGGYTQAKEIARKSLVQALVRSGDLVAVGGSGASDEANEKARESWGKKVWHAEDEGSVLEVPHLSPSLQPTPTSLVCSSSPSSPTLLSLNPLQSSPYFASTTSNTNPPPHTPADSPLLRPISLPSPTEAEWRRHDEVDEGEKTPTNERHGWELPIVSSQRG